MGKGAFGKVRIVERKDTGLTFALKYIRKDEGEFGTRSRRGASERLMHDSCQIGKCSKHHPRATHAGTSEPSLSL